MILKYAVYTAAENGLTLYDVKQLLTNPDFRTRIVRQTKDMEAKMFWRWYAGAPSDSADSVINKLDAFAGTSLMRHIIGQTDGLDMAQVVRERKILLVPLDAIAMGEANASMLGSMLVDQLWTQARLRPKSERHPIMLVLDEFQKFLELNVTVEDMLPLARSYELAVVAAHQHLGQLSRRPAVLAEMRNNARTKIAFALGPEDAGKLEDHFKPLTKLDLQHLPQYEVAASLMTEDGQAPVVTARTFPPPPATGHGGAAQAASRARYGKPVAEIQETLRERYRAADKAKPRPRIGGRSDP
jgi:hypothetical protein